MSSVFLRATHFISAGTLKKKVPLCRTCKYFDSGTCKLYIQPLWDGKLMYASTPVVRADPNLCGPDGQYYVDSGLDRTWSPEEELSL